MCISVLSITSAGPASRSLVHENLSFLDVFRARYAATRKIAPKPKTIAALAGPDQVEKE